MKNTYLAIVVLLSSFTLAGQDWPQFRGPDRDGKSMETGLLKIWPEGGPTLVWASEVDLGQGYASIAKVGNQIFTTGMVEGKGHLFALDLDGKLIWEKEYGPEWTESFPGTRATPMIQGDRIYLFSGHAVANCFDLKGNLIWQRDLKKESQAQDTSFGWSDSGIIANGMFIVVPGGEKASVVSLDAQDGTVKWTADIKDRTGKTNDVSAYAESIAVDRGGKNIYISRTYDTLFGIDTSNGTVLWHYNTHEFTDKNKPVWDQAHPNAPVYLEGEFFISSGYNMGGAKFKISEDGTQLTKVWENLDFDCHHHGYVLVNGNLYGSNWINNSKGNWASVNWETGKLNYDTSWLGTKGVTLYADGMLYCYEEVKGNVALVKANPKEFKVISSFQIPKGKEKFHWAHPAIVDGKLYIRYGSILRCFDIKGS